MQRLFNFKEKRFAVYGLGLTGKSVVKFLKKNKANKKNEEEFSDSEIADIMTEDYEEDNLEINDIEKIQINVPQLKQILSNRLKSYHEKHIDNLINLYNFVHTFCLL